MVNPGSRVVVLPTPEWQHVDWLGARLRRCFGPTGSTAAQCPLQV